MTEPTILTAFGPNDLQVDVRATLNNMLARLATLTGSKLPLSDSPITSSGVVPAGNFGQLTEIRGNNIATTLPSPAGVEHGVLIDLISLGDGNTVGGVAVQKYGRFFAYANGVAGSGAAWIQVLPTAAASSPGGGGGGGAVPTTGYRYYKIRVMDNNTEPNNLVRIEEITLNDSDSDPILGSWTSTAANPNNPASCLNDSTGNIFGSDYNNDGGGSLPFSLFFDAGSSKIVRSVVIKYPLFQEQYGPRDFTIYGSNTPFPVTNDTTDGTLLKMVTGAIVSQDSGGTYTVTLS